MPGVQYLLADSLDHGHLTAGLYAGYALHQTPMDGLYYEETGSRLSIQVQNTNHGSMIFRAGLNYALPLSTNFNLNLSTVYHVSDFGKEISEFGAPNAPTLFTETRNPGPAHRAMVAAGISIRFYKRNS